MKVEIWGKNGTIFKTKAKSLKIGMHTNIGNGKKYLSVQLDDKELCFNNTLVDIREEGEFDEDRTDNPRKLPKM